MSTIDKMLIKGIRSFSPDNVNVIEFYRPLTLIVGHNGAGKTTIIECLQQACTGTLPPNSGKGQHWILHPKVAGETEVKAQIKLRFRTATSQPVVIIRTFQLTQKKTALQFKAVDQSLQTYNKDTFEKQALSYRCSDIDRLVPQAMGVSKAVLENVVFVHQEDSNWPLADGQTLKKKFDDIFNATKYTKALEALRKLKNEKAADVKLLTLEKTNLNTLKDTAARFRDDVRTQGEALEEKEGHRRHLQEEMKVAKAQMDTISTQLERFTGFDDEMRHLEMQQEMVAKQLAAMQTRLEAQEQGDALEGTSLEDVEDWLREFEENQNQSGTYQKLLQVKSQILSLRQTMAARREEQERLLPRQGTLQAEADAHSRQLVDRDQFMRDAAQETGLLQLPPGGTLPVDTVAQFSRALAAKLQDLSVQLREVKDNNRRRDEEKGALIDGVRQDIQNHDLEQSNKHKRLREGEDKARQLNQQLSSISVNQLALASFVRREEECKSSLDKERERLHRLDVDVQLRTLSAAAEADKHKIDQLRQERAQLAAAGEALTRLGLKREALQQKQERIQRLVEAQHSNLEQVLKRADLPEPDQLSALVQQAVRTAQEELDARQAELNVAKQNLSSKGAVLSETQSQLSSKEQELQQAQMQLSTQLRAVVQEDAVQQPLTNVVNTLEQKRVQQHNQKARLDSMTTMVTHNKTHAQEHKECHTCGRRLAEGREMDDFFSRQDQTLSAVPSQKARLETSMNKLKTQLQTLKNLQPLSVRADALKERELPVLRKKAAELQAEVVQLEGRESELADCMVAVSVDAKVASDVQRDVAWPLTRLLGEVQDIKRDITQLEADLQQGTGQRTLQDVDADMEEAEASKGEQEGKRDQLVLRRDRMRETISGFTAQLHKAQADLMQARHQLQRRTDVEKQLGELQAAGTRLRDELAQQQGAKQPLLDKLHTYQSERESARSADAQVVSQHESRLQEMQTLEIRFRQMSGAIEVYTQEAKADKLQKIKQDLDNCRRKLEKAEQNLQAALTEQAKLENAEQDAEIERRNLKSLLEFKHLEKEQDNRVARMQDIARQKGQAGSREALHQEWVALSGQNQAKRTEADMLSGAIQTLLMNVERAQQGLAAPNLQDIDKKFMHKQVEVETTRMAVNDLDKYHKALEKALLAYHTTKMQDINKVIKELWQKTYRNQDIDMIQIKADADGVRSYNYRVVMNASGAELDMRSRCSAGQKVLACLIIRLALAETFCLNCGILALDEPTTNLDADNSQSLAEALRSIMEARRAQENFQLIVITHDEKFAQLIGTRGHAEYRFRITKDDQQHSLITKEPILE